MLFKVRYQGKTYPVYSVKQKRKAEDCCFLIWDKRWIWIPAYRCKPEEK